MILGKIDKIALYKMSHKSRYWFAKTIFSYLSDGTEIANINRSIESKIILKFNDKKYDYLHNSRLLLFFRRYPKRQDDRIIYEDGENIKMQIKVGDRIISKKTKKLIKKHKFNINTKRKWQIMLYDLAELADKKKLNIQEKHHEFNWIWDKDLIVNWYKPVFYSLEVWPVIFEVLSMYANPNSKKELEDIKEFLEKRL